MSAPPVPAAGLSPRRIRHLRSLGHALSPVVAVGKNGVTPALVQAANAAIERHELIKVRVLAEAPLDRREAAEELARQCRATLAQVLGRTFLLYRRHPKKPRIVFPKTPAPVAPAGTAASRAPGALEAGGAPEEE